MQERVLVCGLRGQFLNLFMLLVVTIVMASGPAGAQAPLGAGEVVTAAFFYGSGNDFLGTGLRRVYPSASADTIIEIPNYTPRSIAIKDATTVVLLAARSTDGPYHDRLFSIDVVAGIATLIGEYQNFREDRTIALLDNGDLLMTFPQGEIHRVDLGTGALTPLAINPDLVGLHKLAVSTTGDVYAMVCSQPATDIVEVQFTSDPTAPVLVPVFTDEHGVECGDMAVGTADDLILFASPVIPTEEYVAATYDPSLYDLMLTYHQAIDGDYVGTYSPRIVSASPDTGQLVDMVSNAVLVGVSGGFSTVENSGPLKNCLATGIDGTPLATDLNATHWFIPGAAPVASVILGDWIQDVAVMPLPEAPPFLCSVPIGPGTTNTAVSIAFLSLVALLWSRRRRYTA